MAFEGLKEQLKDKWSDISSAIQESSAFNNAREKFEEQTPTAQRGIMASIAIFFGFLFLSIPWGYVSDSQDHMSAFSENRGLIQGLLRASRSAKEASPLPPPMAVEALKSKVEMVLKDNRLIPDQIGDMQPMPGRPAQELAPPVVTQTGLAVTLKKLNVEQITSVSHGLHAIGGGVKLMGLDITQSAGQDHYYDLIAHVISFSLPPSVSPETEANDKGKKGAAAKRPSRKTEGDSE